MSILNRASDGLANVLVSLAGSSAMIGTMPKHKLLDICCPQTLGDGRQDMATKTLNRWIELGLFVVNDKDDVKIADEYRTGLRRLNASAFAISEVARRIVLLPDNNKNFWGDEENRSADFTRAASWILAQDVHTFAPTSYTQVEHTTLEQTGSPQVKLFQNDTRWSGFVSWATFLGLGRPDSGKASGGFITDPTPWIRSLVTTLLPHKPYTTVRDFLDGLADVVPILDGGRLRVGVESKLRPDKWKAPASDSISTSLSRALLRLQANGVLRFDDRSDSESRVNLLGGGGRIVQRVTHVQIGDAK